VLVKHTEPKILFEDSDFIAVDKPPLWLSIPGRDPHSPHPVLLNYLKNKHPEIWTIHRLDVQTSGVLLFAKSQNAHKMASLWFQTRKIKKKYQALCQGAPRYPSFKISTMVAERPALSLATVLSQANECFLCEIQIKTGRRHQIRIHLSTEGYPLLGDVQYGGPSIINEIEINRVALHACELELPNGLYFKSDLPDDLKSWSKMLHLL